MSAKLQFLSGAPVWTPTPTPNQLPPLPGGGLMQDGYPLGMPKPGNTRGGSITGGDFGGMGGPQPTVASKAGCDEPGMTDFQRGLCMVGKDPLGGIGAVLGNVLGDPVGSVAKGAGTVAGEVISPLVTKIALLALGGLFLGIGVFALARGPASQIIAGVKDGIREARA